MCSRAEAAMCCLLSPPAKDASEAHFDAGPPVRDILPQPQLDDAGTALQAGRPIAAIPAHMQTRRQHFTKQCWALLQRQRLRAAGEPWLANQCTLRTRSCGHGPAAPHPAPQQSRCHGRGQNRWRVSQPLCSKWGSHTCGMCERQRPLAAQLPRPPECQATAKPLLTWPWQTVLSQRVGTPCPRPLCHWQARRCSTPR